MSGGMLSMGGCWPGSVVRGDNVQGDNIRWVLVWGDLVLVPCLHDGEATQENGKCTCIIARIRRKKGPELKTDLTYRTYVNAHK